MRGHALLPGLRDLLVKIKNYGLPVSTQVVSKSEVRILYASRYPYTEWAVQDRDGLLVCNDSPGPYEYNVGSPESVFQYLVGRVISTSSITESLTFNGGWSDFPSAVS